jgi:hypothetical protein
VRLLSDQIQEFMDWLVQNTDASEWDQLVVDEVHKKLITFMISDPPTYIGPIPTTILKEDL